MADYGDVQAFDRKHQLARTKRDVLRPLIEDCYRHVLPLQERRQPQNKSSDSEPDFSDLYDSTAAANAQNLASEMLDDIWPVDSKPFTLALGKHAKGDTALQDRVNKELASRADILIEAINNSGENEGEGWYAAAHEAMLDWTIAQGTIARHVGDARTPIRFEALPLPTICTLRGPFGATESLFRTSRRRRSDILALWPSAKQHTQNWNPETTDIEEEVVEGIWRDRSGRELEECWVTQVRVTGINEFVAQKVDKGIGSKPFIDFAYMRASGETLGRGPAMLAMPDIRVLNKIKEMHLELLDLQLWGIWGYEDSSMNVDNLPALSPRMVVPFEPGSKGLHRVDGSPNANAIEHVVAALQANIRDVLYGLDLGPTDQTPRSATEVMARQSLRSRRRAGPNARLVSGLLNQTVQATNWVLTDKGVVGSIELDGKQVVIKPLSPITRSQQIDDVLRFDKFAEIMLKNYGQAALLTMSSLDQVGPWVGDRLGVDKRMLAAPEAIKAGQQQLVQAAISQQQGAPSTAPTAGGGAQMPAAA